MSKCWKCSCRKTVPLVIILLEACHCIFTCFNGQICINVYPFRAHVAMMYLYQHTDTNTHILTYVLYTYKIHTYAHSFRMYKLPDRLIFAILTGVCWRRRKPFFFTRKLDDGCLGREKHHQGILRVRKNEKMSTENTLKGVNLFCYTNRQNHSVLYVIL